MQKDREKYSDSQLLKLTLCVFLTPLVSEAVPLWSVSSQVSSVLAFASKAEPTKKNKKLKVKKAALAKNKTLKKPKVSPDAFFSSPLIDKISRRQAKRMKRVVYFKKKGTLGEADNGLLKIRSTKALSKKEIQLLSQLVKVENSDREKIFQEMTKDGYYSKKNRKEMRARYFRYFRQMDPKGVYFFQADHWHKK
jgi:hypothetical protein